MNTIQISDFADNRRKRLKKIAQQYGNTFMTTQIRFDIKKAYKENLETDTSFSRIYKNQYFTEKILPYEMV